MLNLHFEIIYTQFNGIAQASLVPDLLQMLGWGQKVLSKPSQTILKYLGQENAIQTLGSEDEHFLSIAESTFYSS